MNPSKFVLALLVGPVLLYFGCTRSPTNTPLTDNPSIYFEVAENKIIMYHNATYDCYVEIRIIVNHNGATIDFVEQNYSTEECDSLCTFNLKRSTDGLETDYYDCRIWNSDMVNIIYQKTVCVQGDDPG